MQVKMLKEPEIRKLVDPAAALGEVREAFVGLSRGEATLPDVLHLDIPSHRGEAHVKGAYLHGSGLWSVKAATGFYGNPDRGLPVAGGLSLVFSAETGFLRTVLFDNGYLTELRTGSAGALAADLLANPELAQVAVIGSGGQARYQLEALLTVRRPERVLVYGRNAASAAEYATEMSAVHDLNVTVADSVREAVADADLIITTTPAREPILKAEWVRSGTHITAMGSDLPEKQELDLDLVASADLVVADYLPQCKTQGEIHHALRAGVLDEANVAELGAIADGRSPGRRAASDVTIADLTGLGIQDAAMANLVARKAEEAGLGDVFEV